MTPQEECSLSPVEKPEQQRPRKEDKHHIPNKEQNPAGFLKQLLPKDFDTGDLFVIFLLLLMAGDSEESRNNALLTLALYFIM